MVDCQWHWYPPAFFEAVLDRDGYPRAARADGQLVYELGPGAALRIEPKHVDLEVQVAAMDAARIDAVVSSPASIGVDGFPAAEARELAQLLNEESARAERELPGRYHGLATLPLVDTDASLAVLDDAVGRLGLRGVFLHSNVEGEPLDAERLRPVYARLAELGVPVFLHPTRTVMAPSLDRYGLEYVVGFVFDTTVAALNLVFGGVLDEFPDLRVVHPHLGATLPFLAGRIDKEYAQPWALARRLPRPPSAYLREFYTDTVALNPGALALAKEFYGVERILFATDYPWWPADEGAEFARAHLDGDEASAVFAGNARRLLGL